MSNSVRVFLATILVLGSLFGNEILETVNNFIPNIKPEPKPEVVIEEPSSKNKEIVKSIVDIDISKEDADLISSFFNELAEVVNDDDEVVKTTAQFRSFNILAGMLHFDNSLKNKYSTLGENIDSAIIETIGKESVSLDTQKRKSLVEILKAIAWSVHQ
jgi:hypothetical protein